MSKIWSPTRPLCSPVVLGPGARTVTRWSTGRLLMPVRPPPVAGLGSGTARLTETILLTPGNITALATARRAISRHPLLGSSGAAGGGKREGCVGHRGDRGCRQGVDQPVEQAL